MECLHKSSVGFDVLGLAGNELFSDDSCYREWFCVAEAIRHEDKMSKVYVASSLLGDVDALLDFVYMVNNKEMAICTYYDTVGRFKDEAEYRKWVSNVREVQKAGYQVTVSVTFTDDFIHDDIGRIPDGTDIVLVPPYVSEAWLMEASTNAATPQEYNLSLRDIIKNLPKREDALKWYKEHPVLAADFASCDCIPAEIADRREEGFNCAPSAEMKKTADCGHPYFAFCYADSDKCAMCDAGEEH